MPIITNTSTEFFVVPLLGRVLAPGEWVDVADATPFLDHPFLTVSDAKPTPTPAPAPTPVVQAPPSPEPVAPVEAVPTPSSSVPQAPVDPPVGLET